MVRSIGEIVKRALATLVMFALAATPLVLGSSSVLAETESELGTLRVFLKKHCVECHDEDAPEGGLDLVKISSDLADPETRRRWVYLHDRVADGEMPPPSSRSVLDDGERASFLTTLGTTLTQADLANREVVLRRLNRTEYHYAVEDLFGIHADLSEILPAESPEQGFDTIGSRLSLSAEQMRLYIEAADVVLDEVFGPDQAPRRIRQTVNIKDLRSKDTADRLTPQGAVLFSGAKTLPLYGASVPGPGLYRLRIQARAIQSDEPVVMRVEGGVTGRIPGHVAGFYEVPPDEMVTIELVDRAIERSDTFAFGLERGFPWWSVDADSYGGPGLMLGDIEIEGPLEPWPRPSREALLADVDSGTDPLDDIRVTLERILPKAFRRAIQPEEAEPYVQLAAGALQEGLPAEKALRRALKGILCAPEFLFMEETFLEDEERPIPTVDAFTLANRLSFWLWRSMPDEILHELARSGDLMEPEVLREQVERMLRDPKAERFIRDFTDQWLRLRDIDFTVPDQRLYPEYDQLLRHSMLEETRGFFRELLVQDLPIHNFLDSDFVMINGPLAEFYGISGVDGLRTRRVELGPNRVRGGLLTQASVLKVSADGTRTSPVLRGAWILENLFGTPPPPPPPSVAAIEPDIRGAETIREQLALHRSHESCNRCHRRIDPPGFALESFDVIGGWRTWYRTTGEGKYVDRPLHPQAPRHTVRFRQGPPVDASGVMADGRAFSGIREYKQLLAEDELAMPRALTRILLTYSLGREMGFSDRTSIDDITARAGSSDFGLRSLIHAVAQSNTFRSP